jgi:hypothetical protein
MEISSAPPATVHIHPMAISPLSLVWSRFSTQIILVMDTTERVCCISPKPVVLNPSQPNLL